MSESFEERIAAARALMAEDKATEAFGELRWVFFDPELAGDRERFVEAITALRPILASVVGEQTATVAEAVAQSPDDSQVLYGLGYALIELGLPDVAACALGRANSLTPGEEPIVTELVAALERDGRNQEACEVLRAEPQLCEQSFVCRYLLAFNSVLSADLDGARALLPTLESRESEDEAYMASRVAAMLQRADLLKETSDLGHQDLRGWHFVTTGGLLLHLSPYGFDDGMNGRYAYVSDTMELCKLGLTRLQALLEAWDEAPPWILAPPDRDSQILAAAAEEILGLPVVEYSADAGPGLIVVYDLNRLAQDTPAEILQHSPGQILYAHATCWTDPPRCAPDVTTLLYQALQTPWGERMKVDEDGEVETTAADERTEDDIAADIVAASDENEELESFDPVDALLAVARAAGPGMAFREEEGRRSPLWEGGPVKSSKFV